MSETQQAVSSRTEDEPKERIVVEYQATDENGNPIGSPTHLEADTWQEMSRKQQDAHVNAMRWANRLKNAKPTYKVDPLAPRQLTQDEELQAAVDLRDPAKAKKAFRTLLESELPIQQLEEQGRELRVATEKQNRLSAVHQFLTLHPEFFNCDANGQVLANYLDENNLQWTPDNLEIAYASEAGKLAAQPAPVPQVTQQPPNAPQPRRPSTPDVEPGGLSGAPPVTRTKTLTKADYIRMQRENPAEWRRHFNTPSLRRALDKALGS